ncbi:hypothetical protein B0J14DRAFT_680721 [Halenospora varia]|nr:hypothetical protein B0J14DRAFT_680721 [Halenospora varia]
MSFGYSVGDFIAIVQLAYKIWDNCKSSPDQYRDIGRDVGNTHLVLSAIERYWKAEEARGRKLIGAQEDDLRQLASAKHRKLGERGNLTDKLKWAISTFARDIGPLSQALQDNTQALAIFNATLTAENASEQSDGHLKLLQTQGRLLEYLATRYWEFQTGTGSKAEPAFSQVAVKDISEDEAPSWQVIDEELEEAGFESAIVRSNRGFIWNWIGTVIPEDEPQDVEAAEFARLSIAEQKQENNESDPRIEEQPGVAPVPLLEQVPRSVSPSLHGSQSSTWRDTTARDPNLAAKLLAKVFESKYGEDCDELYLALIQRAFYHIDWTGRGWLPRTDVERYCKEAGNLANFQLDDDILSRVVKLMDTDADYEITLEELKGTVMTIRFNLLETIVSKSNVSGMLDAGIRLKTFFESRSDNSRIPTHWHRHTDTMAGNYYHELLFTPQHLPPLHKNFTNAGFIACTYCGSQISNAISAWRTALTGFPGTEAGEYKTALNDVLRVTAKFHLLDTDHFGNQLHDLDRFRSQIDLLPLGTYRDFADCPIEDLGKRLTQLWDILHLILGFTYDLKPFDTEEINLEIPWKASFNIGNIPPTLAEWRRL